MMETLLAITQPPVSVRYESHPLRNLIRCLLPVLLLLTTLQMPPPFHEMACRIMQRLDPNFHGSLFRGRDLFVIVENQRYLFWLNAGELPETLLEITEKISPDLSQLNRRGMQRQRRRNCKIKKVNKVLLTFMWLRKYPCLDTLALIFDVSPSTVSTIIHSVAPVLWRYFQNQVVWPSIVQWNALRGNWSSFPDAVGCIDGTPHRIYRPLVEPQEDFYSGHRHYHLMNTQLIVDNLGNIVFLQAGFLGALNDAGTYNLMERIGPGTNYAMPRNTVLLADRAYGDVCPLLTPFRAAQIRRMPWHERRVARKFNRRHSRCRMIVEHTIKHV